MTDKAKKPTDSKVNKEISRKEYRHYLMEFDSAVCSALAISQAIGTRMAKSNIDADVRQQPANPQMLAPSQF